jgi:hypothetical protein
VVVPRRASRATTTGGKRPTIGGVSAADLHHRLRLLELERLEAQHIGLINCQQYRRDLEEEMAECRVAYVGAAVTEIATLRAELSGRPVG